MNHTEECVEAGGCDPAPVSWMQPSGTWVSEAENQLGDDVPWCVVHQLAWQLQEADEHE